MANSFNPSVGGGISNYSNNQSYNTSGSYGGGTYYNMNDTYTASNQFINPSTKFKDLSNDIQERIRKLYLNTNKKQAPIQTFLNIPTINTVISNLKSLPTFFITKKFEELLKFKEFVKNRNFLESNIKIKEEINEIKERLIEDINYYNENVENLNVLENCMDLIDGFVVEIESLEKNVN